MVCFVWFGFDCLSLILLSDWQLIPVLSGKKLSLHPCVYENNLLGLLPCADKCGMTAVGVRAYTAHGIKLIGDHSLAWENDKLPFPV